MLICANSGIAHVCPPNAPSACGRPSMTEFLWPKTTPRERYRAAKAVPAHDRTRTRPRPHISLSLSFEYTQAIGPAAAFIASTGASERHGCIVHCGSLGGRSMNMRSLRRSAPAAKFGALCTLPEARRTFLATCSFTKDRQPVEQHER